MQFPAQLYSIEKQGFARLPMANYYGFVGNTCPASCNFQHFTRIFEKSPR